VKATSRQRAQRRTNALRRLDTLVRQALVPMHVYIELRAGILQDPRFFETVEFYLGRGHEAESALWRARTDVEFFLEHACPGEPECAVGLARAEAYAADHDWEVTWNDDESGWDEARHDMSEEDLAELTGIVEAILYDTGGPKYPILGSLHGIQEGYDYEANRAYRRVVAAELALEAMPP